MKQEYKYWWLVLIKGVILIALAFYVFGNPVSALVGLVFYIGIGLLITGIFLIVVALSLRKTEENWGWRLAEGIIDVLFAFMLLANPGVTAAIIPFVLGFWMMVYGVLLFVATFSAKKEGIENWWMGLISGVLSVVFGYLISSNLLAGAIAITIWIGIGFLTAGIVNVTFSLAMRRLYKASA